MLEKTIEQLLLQYLAPYVDGISRDKLHLGVFSGSLQLEGLTVKPEALSLLGFEGLRVRSGGIQLINLKIPLRDWYKGKLYAMVNTVNFDVEQMADDQANQTEDEMVQELREAKRKAIDLRMNQLRDLVEDQRDEQGGKRQTYFVKFIRKIIANIRIEISSVDVSCVSSRGLACGFELPNLAVLSTDTTFREVGEKEEVVLEGKSMYKLVRLQGLGFRMSLPGSTDIKNAGYVISPISASLQLAHDLDNPSDQVIRARLEVATDQLASLTLLRSQIKHLRLIYAEYQDWSARLHDIMVPAKEEHTIFTDPKSTKEEYVQIYERQLWEEWNLGTDKGEFTPADANRMELIEAALSVRLLAKYRWTVRSKVEALNEEIARRQRAAELARLEEEKAQKGWFGRARHRLLGSDATATSTDTLEEPSRWISDEEREQLLKDMEDEFLVETVDVPQRWEFDIVVGNLALDLVDDRWDDDEHKQLLNVQLKDAGVHLGVHRTQDYRGQDTAAWQFDINLKNFHALHKQKSAIRFDPASLGLAETFPSCDGSAAAEHDDTLEGWHDVVSSEPVAYATQWHIENELQKECNMLKLHFDFKPLLVNLPHGALEQLLDFIRAPDMQAQGQDTSESHKPQKLPRILSAGHEELNYEEYVDSATRVWAAYGLKASDVASQVYERIPDKIELNLHIASPVVTVPVVELGTAKFCLGELCLRTTQPAELFSWDLALDLNHTSLRAESVRGERFDMIHPVPVHLLIDYRGKEEGHALNVEMKVEEMTANLSPQALSILLATPMAAISIIYPNYGEATAVKLDEATAAAMAASTPASGSSWAQRVNDFARDVKAEEALQALEAATKKLSDMKRKMFRCNYALQINTVSLTLSDSIMPVMRFQGKMLKPGLVLYFQNVPHMLCLDLHDGLLEWDVLNSRNGTWEPFAERFHLGVHLERKAEGDDGRMTNVVVSGKQQLLLNLTPVAIQRAAWILPQFYKSLTFQPLDGESGGKTSAGGAESAKYRVVNLSDRSVELEFLSRHRQGLNFEVKPTGSSWKSLDDFVLPHFATAVIARMPDANGAPSEPLSLERNAAVGIPGTGLVAELITPDPLHHLILIATPLRVHNQTDLELLIRFHSPVDRGLLEADLPVSNVCDAALLGYAAPECLHSPHETKAIAVAHHVPHSLALPPNAMCAVPEIALARKGGAGLHYSFTWLSARPAKYEVKFCMPVEVGTGMSPSAFVCRSNTVPPSTDKRVGMPANPKDMHLLCESRWYDGLGNRSNVVEGDQARATPSFKVTTAVLQPTLSLVNALPIGNFQAAFAPMMSGEEIPPANKFLGVHVPCFKRLNLYCFPGVLNHGMCVQVRLSNEAPWSSGPTRISRDAFKESESTDSENTRVLEVRMHKGGAAAGVVVEPNSRYELRFSCPYWFIDRSGLDSRIYRLALQRKGLSLPSSQGITLLPADCLEQSCELALHVQSQTAQGPVWQKRHEKEFRFPPNFCTLPWATSIKPFVFCVQADDVVRKDLLGAQCQVMTLRPRLVLTNSADCTVELEFAEARDVRTDSLEPQLSMDWHWMAPNDDDAPTTSIRFRPCRRPSSHWSGKVMCGDASAGSTPFYLPSGEIWSVDVAPVRGALAVSFRKGSDFVAINKTHEKSLHMEIKPRGCRSSIPVPPGEEVPYGWAEPFSTKLGRGVDVYISGHHIPIDDVRGRVRKEVARFKVAIVVVKEGDRTVLTLEDYHNLARMTTGESYYQVELKLSSLGISLVEESRELLYLNFELLRFEWIRNNRGIQTIGLAISEAQVNCQNEGRVDANTRDARRQEVLALLKQERPVVIATNLAESDRAFLHLVLKRGATSSRDILLHHAQIAMDALDVTIDEDWLTPLVSFVKQSSDSRHDSGVAFSHIAQTAGRPIIACYEPPPLPYVLQVDSLKISQVCLTMWTSLKLRSVSFLPNAWRNAIRVLSFSETLKLDGATLTLPERDLPPHRGSLGDFLRGLAGEYSRNFLNHAASVLGKSSVLNVPRAPVKVGGTAFAYMADSFGLVAGETGALLNNVTMDDEYVSKQRAIRQNKKINGLGDGVAEAGKSLALGVEGMADIFTKSAEGAKTGGVGGLLAGMGKGAVGTFVKPFSAMGQAMQDLGAGVASALTPDTAVMKRRRDRIRTRLPRMIYTELGVIRPWSEFDAQALMQLGSSLIKGVVEIVPLMVLEGNDHGEHFTFRRVLLIFTSRFMVADVSPEGMTQVGGSSSSASSQVTSTPSRRASSASTTGGNEPDQSQDFMDDLDNSAFKMFSQVLKPINTVVYGIQDLQQGSAAPGSNESEQARTARERQVKFEDLTSVSPQPNGLQLVHAKGYKMTLPTGMLSAAAKEALCNGFRSSLMREGRQRGVANWEELRQVLSREQRERAESCCREDSSLIADGAGAGERILEVFEVERYKHITNTWETPFQPLIDSETCWRWVDGSGNRHPHLSPGEQQVLSQAGRYPPCALDKMFKPKSTWSVEKHAGTDDQGWRYALAWNSSTWDSKPGLFDGVRKRKWTRTYA